MTQVQVGSLSLKLIGIYSIIEAIPILKSLSEAFSFRGTDIGTNGPLDISLFLIGVMITFCLLILMGVCLITFSKVLAKKMAVENEIKDSFTELSAKNIQSIAFSVVGLVIVVIAIPHLVQLAANLQAYKNLGSELPKQSISIGTWAYSIGLAVQLIIGILLFFGGRGLSNIWHFFQKTRPMIGIRNNSDM
ncbi:MAG: hypothetical protein ABSE54_08595 [Smithella sp.]|jgi:hypothetical protein